MVGHPCGVNLSLVVLFDLKEGGNGREREVNNVSGAIFKIKPSRTTDFPGTLTIVSSSDLCL